MLEALPAFIWIPELEFWIDQYENNPKHLAKRPQRLLLVFVVGLETVAQLTESWGPWLNLTQTLWGPRHSGAPDILGGPRHSGAPDTLSHVGHIAAMQQLRAILLHDQCNSHTNNALIFMIFVA